MTVTLRNAVQQLADALAVTMIAETDIKPHQEQLNARLKMWHAHRQQWVAPFDIKDRTGSPQTPAFEPRWSNFRIDASTDTYFLFALAVNGTTEKIQIPIEFFTDPEVWLSADKETRVTVAQWHASRKEEVRSWVKSEDDKAADRLRARGWKVEKA